MEERRRVTTVRQLDHLFNYMERNRDLALGRVRSKEARALALRLWNECSEMLNSLGPARTGKEWAKVWNDQKCKVRHKLVVINASRQATGGGPSNAPDLSPLEEKVANIIGRDVGPMPHVRQDQFAGDSNVLEEMEETVEEMMEAVEEVAELPPFPGSNPENSVPTVMNIPYEDQPPSPVPSISGQAPRPIRVRGRRRRAERVVHYPATNHMQASQATTNRSALDESRSMLLKIEEMRAEAALNNSRAMVNVSESLRIIADSIDRMSRQYCSSRNPEQEPHS